MKTKIIIILAMPILFIAGLITGQNNGFENKEKGKILGLNHVGIRVGLYITLILLNPLKKNSNYHLNNISP